MSDPLFEIFGLSTPELFAKRELWLQHGPLERFPAFMRQGPLADTEALVQFYGGPLEVAQGTAAEGVQTPIQGIHPAVLLKLGLTVFFSELRTAVPHAHSWLKQLERCLGLAECAGLMAFANATGSGLGLHHDRFDQLFFQLRGEKMFHFAPNTYVQQPDVQFSPYGAAPPGFAQTYSQGFPASSEEVLKEPFQSVLLKPGSAFFMPAGVWHTTAGQSEASLSLVVAVRAPSHLDLLENLLRHYASQSPAWRMRSYGGWSADPSEATRAHAVLADLMQDLAQRLPQLPVESAYSAWSTHGYTVGSQSEYPLHARFERYIRLPNSSVSFEGLDDGGIHCMVRSGPNAVPQAQSRLLVNEVACAAIDWILTTRASFTVSEICEQFPQVLRTELEALLAWLSHAALLRPLPTPVW